MRCPRATELFGQVRVNPQYSIGLYGLPAPDLAEIPEGALQFSPQIPGALALEDVPPASLGGMVMAAPPGTVERRYALALSLLALRPGARFLAMAPKTKGGGRIAKELEGLGCKVESTSRRHQRVIQTTRPAEFEKPAAGLVDDAIAAGGPCFIDALGFWSQPGVFSWDRIDSGTVLLLSTLPPLAGQGADLGCGIGVVARAVLAEAGVTRIDLIDIDRRAIAAARRNITDRRAALQWADVRTLTGLSDLDFVITNPPFHDGGREDRALGEVFLRQSHRALRDGGVAWLVANVHLPYESVLNAAFSHVALRAEKGGFKVFEARK